MSGTRRTPLARRPTTQVTERAVELFVEMAKLRCSCPSPKRVTQGPCLGCAAWYDLHADLHDELKLKPWQWPCAARESPKHAGSTCWNYEIAARMALLKDAAKARRTASSEKEGIRCSVSSRNFFAIIASSVRHPTWRGEHSRHYRPRRLFRVTA